MDDSKELIPGLPDDLALHCLARIPRRQLIVCSVLSKAWKTLIFDKYMEIVEMRRSIGIFEWWPFVLLQGQRETGKVWRALDPVNLHWETLPEYADETFHNGDKECFVAGRNLLVVGVNAVVLPMNDGYTVELRQMIWNYDVDNSGWEHAPSMNVPRCMFASASMDHFGYVAGGSVLGQGRVSNCAERYNSVTKTWETLPAMASERRECSGFIMNDRFYVIGGVNSEGGRHDDSEYYDPRTNSWSTVPGFWPTVPREEGDRRPAMNQGAPPLVAVLQNELYSLNASANELKHYNKANCEWTVVTSVPGRVVSPVESGYGLAFKAVDGELWVIGGRSARGSVGDIQAFTPDPVNGQHTPWRRVTGTYSGDGFCLNCAIMKM